MLIEICGSTINKAWDNWGKLVGCIYEENEESERDSGVIAPLYLTLQLNAFIEVVLS